MTAPEIHPTEGAMARPRRTWAALPLLLTACGTGTTTSPDSALRLELERVDLGIWDVWDHFSIYVELENTSTDDVVVVPPASVGPFSFNAYPRELGPGQSAQLSVYFEPREAGIYESEVKVRAEGASEGPTLTVTGRSDDCMAYSGPPVDFGPVRMGAEARRDVTLTNCTAADHEISFQNQGCGPDSNAPYCIDLPDSPPTVIPGHGTFDLPVVFAPGRGGFRPYGLVVRACKLGYACQGVIEVRGEPITKPLECSPRYVEFGDTPTGGCLSEVVTCHNVVQEDLPVLRVGPSSDMETDPAFTITALSPVGPLAPGGVFEVRVDFCPTERTWASGELEIELDLEEADQRFVGIHLDGIGR